MGEAGCKKKGKEGELSLGPLLSGLPEAHTHTQHTHVQKQSSEHKFFLLVSGEKRKMFVLLSKRRDFCLKSATQEFLQ